MASMYFIALVTPEKINDQILRWKQYMRDQFSCVVALRSPAHITLIPPFWMDEGLQATLENAIAVFSKQQNPFEIIVNGFSAFKPRAIYADISPNEALISLQLQLQDYMLSNKLARVEREERSYHPHITLAARDLRKKDFYTAWEIFKEKKYEASWRVGGISILKHKQKNWDVIFTSQFST